MLRIDDSDEVYIRSSRTNIMVCLYCLLMCDFHSVCLLADDALASFCHLFRVWDASLVPIENGRDLLECVAPGLGVVKVCGQAVCDDDGDIHDVVLPANCIESDWVDEGVEDDCYCDCDSNNRKTTRSEMVWPDFARVGRDQRRAAQR